MSWSRRGSYHPSARLSSAVTNGGFRTALDPTLPSYSRAVVSTDGSRVGIVSRVGSQYVGDWGSDCKYNSLMDATRGCESAISSSSE